MKNWLTYSTALIPKSFLAFAGKSRLSSLPENSCLFKDHSASEILKKRSLLSVAVALDPSSLPDFEPQERVEKAIGAASVARPRVFRNWSRFIVTVWLD